MRKPDTIERLYLDFDGFFASVMQHIYPELRGKPIGVVPFANTDRTVVIAYSKEAKKRGCKNVMSIKDARRICPQIILVPQEPDLYRRAHNTLIAEITAVIPIDAIKSIDELTCVLDAPQRANPEGLAAKIKARLVKYVGPHITCSIGFAANRQLAKIACKQDKPDGVTIWHPHMMPGPLLDQTFDDIPGIGERMAQRLHRNRIHTVKQLLAIQPKHMRKLWGNVTGERLWYALHGYDIQAEESERGMFGHGRVLPPESRSMPAAKEIARLLLIKAGRRLRKEDFYAGGFWLYLSIHDGAWSRSLRLAAVNDDKAILTALETLWTQAAKEVGRLKVYRVHVTLIDLTPATERQTDFLLADDAERQKWEAVTSAVDSLNRKYASTIISQGPWNPPAGGNVGGKISYTRIPQWDDFI